MRPVARIAQSVEQGIENPRVGGSIPSPGTTNTENPQAKLNSLGFFIARVFIAANIRTLRTSATEILHDHTDVLTGKLVHRS
jgi:hypothetical protein